MLKAVHIYCLSNPFYMVYHYCYPHITEAGCGWEIGVCLRPLGKFMAKRVPSHSTYALELLHSTNSGCYWLQSAKQSLVHPVPNKIWMQKTVPTVSCTRTHFYWRIRAFIIYFSLDYLIITLLINLLGLKGLEQVEVRGFF